MPSDHIYYYTDGACGSGKTYQALSKIVLSGGKHLFVVDRKETMAERQATLTGIALQTGHEMPTLCVASGDDRNIKQFGVRRRIHDLPADFDRQPDVCVFVTHEAMRLCDFTEFTDWSIWIDETPDILDNESINIAVSHVLFERLYDLEPVLNDDGTTSGWSEIKPKDTSVDLAMIASDDVAQAMRSLHRRVQEAASTGRRNVIVNGTSWADFAGKKCNWHSVWSPELIGNFQSVTFLANAFRDSLTFQIMQAKWPNIEWVEVRTNAGRDFKPRNVTIHYYADSHVASRNLFSSDAGKSNLAAVCADINERVSGRDHIWMCNRSQDDRIPLVGRKLSPKQAGSNEYKHVSAATCIYSVKPDKDQRKVYDLLGVDPAYYTETNERETILQFACRTSARDPDSTTPIDLFVYDWEQALYLLRYFERDLRGYATATSVLHDLGFAATERKVGRPVIRTPEEKRKSARERTQRYRARKADAA